MDSMRRWRKRRGAPDASLEGPARARRCPASAEDGWWLGALVWLLAAIGAGHGWAAAAERFVVRLHPAHAKTEAARQLASRARVRLVRALQLPGAYVVESGAPRSATLARLSAEAGVLHVAPVRELIAAETLPNDPLFPNQWHLRNTGQSGGTPGADIRATAAWDLTTGTSQLVVAIVDSGLELGHPDLAGRVWTNPGEIAGNGLDDDGNGFPDDVHGWNFYSNSPDVGPTFGHGTNVAGLTGAVANNSLGVAGVDWNARLMVVNIFAPSGTATDADAADGVVYACNNGAKVVNASWGSPGYSAILSDAMAYARAKGVLVCAATGNYNFDADEHPFYPAAQSWDSLIAVSGSTNTDGWVYNYGERAAHLSAPALSLTMARYPSTYGLGSGTSYAAPLVSGVAALVWSREPGLEAGQLKMRLLATAARPSGLAGRSVSQGRLDAWAALTADDPAPTAALDLRFHAAGANGALVEIVPPGSAMAAGELFQLKVSRTALDEIAFAGLADTRLGRVSDTAGRIVAIDGLDPLSVYWIGVRGYSRGGRPGPLAKWSFSTGPARRVFFDACDTTAAVWQAEGFVLAPGSSHSGTLAWQDSPDGNYTSGTLARLVGGPFDISALRRPRLAFYAEHFFPSRLGEGDRLEVLASSDGGASWRTLRRFRATVSPPRRFALALDELGPATALLVQFRLIADANTFVDDGVYLDDISIEEGLGDVPFAHESIVESVDFFGDETSAPTFEREGMWVRDSSKSSAPKLEGAEVLAATPGTPGTLARFVPFVAIAGRYEVLVTHGAGASAGGVTWKVLHADGTTPFSMDQTSANADRWSSLGAYRFEYGRHPDRGAVVLDASTASGAKACADAIRLRLLEPDPPNTRVPTWQVYE